MDKWMEVQNLFERIKLISEEAAHILREAVPNDPDIFTLTNEDLNELLPGEHNSQHRRDIMGLINMISQEQDGQSIDSIPADVMMKADMRRSGESIPSSTSCFGKRETFTETFTESSVSGQLQSSNFKTDLTASFKVHVLVAGETFNTHDAFMKMLKPKSKSKLKQELKLKPKFKFKEVHTQESCNVILLFCPVVSRIETDMEAAMARVTEDKPVILVFMHHCHDPSHMTNITVQPSRSNIVKTIHCAILETKGLLQCNENQQAVEAVRSELKKYKKKNIKKIPQESME